MKHLFFILFLVFAATCVIAQNVGIGTSNPTSKLTVEASGIGITQFSSLNGAHVGFYTSSTGAFVQTHNLFPLHFTTNDEGPQMTLSTAGFFGIGTNTPTSKLDVVGSAKVSGTLTVVDGKGIVRSTTATQMKMKRSAINLNATDLAPGATLTSAYTYFGEDFNSVTVALGQCTSTEGTGGAWQKILVVPYDIDHNNDRCRFKYTNTGNAPATFNANWEMVFIGN